MDSIMRTMWQVCVLLTILTCPVHVQAQGMNAIYRNFYQPSGASEEGNGAEQQSQRWKPLSTRWGMPDASAHVGKVFRYTIPSDAFSGDVIRYQVTEADSQQMPPWLYFDEASNVIEGIPSDADIGQYYISVTAVGHKTNSSSVTEISEVFSVSVSPEDTFRSNGLGAIKEDDSEVVCPKDKVPAVASIILDAEWSRLSAKERVAIVAKMSQYSMLKIGAFRLLPKGRKTALDEKVLVTGPGNNPKGHFSGVSLSWKIGCGENAANLPVVTILETAAQDNSMAREFGHDVIGWQVTGQKMKNKLRVRRQANPAGTPFPTPTPRVTTIATETAMPPSSRVVPSVSTPIVPTPTMVMPTSKKPSRTVTMVSTPIMTPSPTIQPTPTPTPPRSTTPTMPVTPPLTTTVMTSTPVVTTTPTVPPKKPPKTPKPVNQAPVINKEINRIDAREGVPLLFIVPADTFIDEDGNTRDLTIDVVDTQGGKLGKKSWLKFDKQKQMLHGLPPATFPDGRDRNTYVMSAQDRDGKGTRMAIEVVIIKAADQEAVQPPVAMGATLDIDFDEFVNNVELQLEILNRIASIFGDGDASAITITGIKRGSVILSWTNNTIDKDSCPTELINEIMSKLVNPDGTPTQALIDAFAPNFTISGVEAMEAGACIATTTAIVTPTTERSSTEAALPVSPEKQDGAWVTLVATIVVVCILLIAGIIVLLLYRKHRKGKLSDEDNDTFINKGIPIILPDEIEEAEKPPANSTSPLIMSTEKPPLPPPEYNSVQEGSREPLLNGNDNHKISSDEDDKNSLPMTDVSASPPYQKPDPPSSTPPESRKQAPVNTPGYRVPPPYVPP